MSRRGGSAVTPEDLPADALHLDDETRQQLDRGRAQAAGEQPPADPHAWMYMPPPPPPRLFGLSDAVVLTLISLVVACLVGGFLFTLYRSDMRFADTCIKAGGRVHSVSPHICVTEDGRIMDL